MYPALTEGYIKREFVAYLYIFSKSGTKTNSRLNFFFLSTRALFSIDVYAVVTHLAISEWYTIDMVIIILAECVILCKVPHFQKINTTPFRRTR